ncbi:heme utilization cystosolic carrier protein HutX [Pseudohongiella spirulinae]|uniref:Putative heme iron utilization protein n=1 Tax=Pseudohongiella spirulinae TaxID=1249552 RepID=A0A0S2KGA6_9GAMM|nr:heme utilization cystosolic carrier protein HutX [Pseudohongiella spirulinae]ALO47155.1 Putative heme iron utilization protein [Pseudohongiella spirulinae]
MTDAFLPQDQVLPLLKNLTTLGDMTTIVFSGGCVFEFKGPFPAGELGEDFYNLDGPVPGLHGHLRVAAMHHVRFQDRPHRGRDSYAFVFETAEGQVIFKVFLGRDSQGQIFPEQLAAFNNIRDALRVQPS